MTAANRALAIAEELHRADGSLAAAHHLVEGGFLTDAVSRLMKYREEADCNPSNVFTADDVTVLLKETATLAAKIADQIRAAGYPA